MIAADRVQFRLNKSRAARLSDLSREHNLTPNRVAKMLVELALDREQLSVRTLQEDVLVIRAGMEHMFQRSGRAEELEDAISDLRQRRRARPKAAATEAGQ